MTAVSAGGRAARGTALQRARAVAILVIGGLLAALPARAADGIADALGELWYRVAPARAARARGNLAHVASRLAAGGRGSARARAAATDPAALERLVRAAFRHLARTYVETLRWAPTARDARRRLFIETPEAAAAAFAGGGPLVVATPHFGSLVAEAAALFERASVPITAPMETIRDPELQRVMMRARRSSGARIVPLDAARRELQAALARGEGVGLVADRDIAGGGVDVPLFGLPAPLPIGPAWLALEHATPLHVAAVRRGRGGTFAGRLITLPLPPADLPRRARVEALLAAEAKAFEDLVADAPEQWWTVFYPVWATVGPRAPGVP
jgi:KDO2-lipid IV(A) lauroyltransferase